MQIKTLQVAGVILSVEAISTTDRVGIPEVNFRENSEKAKELRAKLPYRIELKCQNFPISHLFLELKNTTISK